MGNGQGAESVAMRFKALPVTGAMEIEAEPEEDARGSFARAFCADEFSAQGLPDHFVQHSLSFNRHAGTLRGLHYQLQRLEAKIVRCVRGEAFDVVVDLRAGADYGKWCAVTLSDRRRNAVFVPAGCAHGFQSLVDETELLYLIDTPYDASAAGGVRWDDPTLAIPWPLADPILSERDRTLPYLP